MGAMPPHSRRPPVTLDGPRLRLRPWRDADLEPLAALSADPVAMRYFPSALTREESDALAARLRAREAEHGFTFWPVELRGGPPEMIGIVGLMRVGWQSSFTPAVEIGWRIAPAHQRRGYAEEAARLALAYGFGPLGLPEIVAFTIPANEPSWRLMEKLGMSRAGEFDHPRVPEGHPMRRHLLYRLTRADWIGQRLQG